MKTEKEFYEATVSVQISVTSFGRPATFEKRSRPIFHPNMTNVYLHALLRFSFGLALTSAFMAPSSRCISPRPALNVAQDMDRPPTFLDQQSVDDDDDLNVLFVEESEEDEAPPDNKVTGAGRQRWENLNPKLKQRLIEKGQQKAIENKKKREPASDKKRRKW